MDDLGPLAHILAQEPRLRRLHGSNLHIAQILQPDVVSRLQGFQVAPADEQPVSSGNLSESPIRSGMQRRVRLSGHIALDLQEHRIPDEEAAVGLQIDQFPVLGIDGVHANADVSLADAKINHELAQRFGPDAPAAHGPHCGHARVFPAGVLTGLYGLSQLAGAEGPELVDLDPAPVDDVRVLPAEIRIEVPLPDSAIGQILAPNDVGRSEQMVLHSRLEVEQRPDTILCPHEGVRGGNDAKRWPVAYGRVFVVHVGLDPQNRIALSKGPVQHLPPEQQVLFYGLIPVLALYAFVLMLLEDRLRAAANVRPVPANQLLSDGIVQVDPLARYDHQIGLGAKPFAVLQIPAIGLRHGPLLHGIGVIKADDELATVFFDVLGVDDDASRAAKGRRSIRIGSKAHHNPLFCSFQCRKTLVRLFSFRELHQKFGGDGFQPLLPLLRARPLHLDQDFIHQGRYLFGPGAQLRVLSHELAHNRPGIGSGLVLHRVLQRVFLDELSDLFHRRANFDHSTLI